jgi:hypothetical protein
MEIYVDIHDGYLWQKGTVFSARYELRLKSG